MNDTMDLIHAEEDITARAILDEALEAAAIADEKMANTWANCTHVWWCWPFSGDARADLMRPC